MMPPGGGAVRGAQVTTLDRIAHEKFISDEIGTLLDDAAATTRRSSTTTPTMRA